MQKTQPPIGMEVKSWEMRKNRNTCTVKNCKKKFMLLKQVSVAQPLNVDCKEIKTSHWFPSNNK